MAARELLEPGAVAETNPRTDAAGLRTTQRNVRVCFYLYFARAVQNAMVTRDFLDLYLFHLSHSNEFVGRVESARGGAALVMIAPIGFLIDRLNRRRMLWGLTVLKFFTTSLCCIAVASDSLALLFPALVLRRIVEGALDQSLEVFLVDNVPEAERRTQIFSRKEMLTWSGTAVGPLLALILILAHALAGGAGGSTAGWSLALLRIVIEFGLLSYFVVDLAAFSLHAVDNECGSVQSRREGGEPPDWTNAKVCFVRKRWLIPIWTDLIWAATQIAGSFSMTYVSLFLRKDFGVGPTVLMLIRFFENAGLALMNLVTPKITARVGRGWAAVFFVFSGAVLMFIFAVSRSAWIAAASFVLRTALARANVPCMQSIIYECVSARHRGRWSAITSFKAVTNGAGAWLGGWLADQTGDYRTGFELTATVHCASAFLLIPVALWLPRESRA